MFLPGYSGLVGKVPAASGARYEADGILFWIKGDEAILEYQGDRWTGCRKNRRKAIWETAKLAGVDFRAVGNEPGWVLEIRGAEIDLNMHYGSTRLRFGQATINSSIAPGETRYSAALNDHTIELTLSPGPCNDSMSDEQLATSVNLVLDGKRYQGCGRALH